MKKLLRKLFLYLFKEDFQRMEAFTRIDLEQERSNILILFRVTLKTQEFQTLRLII